LWGEIMFKIIKSTLIIVLLLMAGCDAAMNMNGKILSVSSGQFVYQDGNLISNYKTGIDQVWAACEKTMKDLNARNVQKERKISTGTIKATIQDEKVIISIEYIDKDLTSVSVFAGVVGNSMASRLIHDRIAGNIVKP
jgi:Protein of unknown function (DUF3568)